MQNDRDSLTILATMTDASSSDNTLYEDSNVFSQSADGEDGARWAFLYTRHPDDDELAALYSETFSQL